MPVSLNSTLRWSNGTKYEFQLYHLLYVRAQAISLSELQFLHSLKMGTISVSHQDTVRIKQYSVLKVLHKRFGTW